MGATHQKSGTGRGGDPRIARPFLARVQEPGEDASIAQPIELRFRSSRDLLDAGEAFYAVHNIKRSSAALSSKSSSMSRRRSSTPSLTSYWSLKFAARISFNCPLSYPTSSRTRLSSRASCNAALPARSRAVISGTRASGRVYSASATSSQTPRTSAASAGESEASSTYEPSATSSAPGEGSNSYPASRTASPISSSSASPPS